MMSIRSPLSTLHSPLLLLFFCVSFAWAQNEPAALSLQQRRLAEKYAQLETVLLRMAEITAQTNPKRAALLKKVIAESKNRLIDVRFEELIAILEKQRLTEAIGGQETLEQDLTDLLKLLESENRAQRRDAEKGKIAKLVRELDEIIHREKAVKAKTAQSEARDRLETEQKDVREQTDRLSDKMGDSQEIGPRSEKDRSPKQQSSGPDAPKKPEAEKQPDVTQPKDKPADTEENDPENVDKSQSPTQQAMQKSLKRMREAEKRLRDAEKDQAVEEQEEAIAQLQKAKAELEKILRQLREEEVMQTLLWLDTRVKKMLRAAKAIRTQTETVAKDDEDRENMPKPVENSRSEMPGALNPEGLKGGPTGKTKHFQNTGKTADEGTNRERQMRMSRLAADTGEMIGDADAAILVLREDGTAQALGESLLQTRFDMADLQTRLTQGDAGTATLAVEQGIIDALEEMLEALDQAKKDAQKRQEELEKQAADGTPPGEMDQRLINMLSELKMIRLMQMRVNDRTERYEKMRTEPHVDLPALKLKVDELARRQTRIGRILNAIKIGKNE